MLTQALKYASFSKGMPKRGLLKVHGKTAILICPLNPVNVEAPVVTFEFTAKFLLKKDPPMELRQ
jgi:hypothetical protein